MIISSRTARHLIAEYHRGRRWAFITDRARREADFDDFFTADEQEALTRVLQEDEAQSQEMDYDLGFLRLLERALRRGGPFMQYARVSLPVLACRGYQTAGLVLSRVDIAVTGVRAFVGLWVDEVGSPRPETDGGEEEGSDGAPSQWLRELALFRSGLLMEPDLISLHDDIGSLYGGPSISHGPMSTVQLMVGGREIRRRTSEWTWQWLPGPPPRARSLTFQVGRRDVGREAVEFDFDVSLPDDWEDIAQEVPMIDVRNVRR